MSESLFSFYRSTIAEHQGWVADVVFDSQQELIWAAGQKGTVASYYSTGLNIYTKFVANSDITQILTVDPGVLTLSAERLNLHSRMGQRQLTVTSPNMKEMCCMSASQTKPEVLLGGHTKTMTKYDLTQNKITAEIMVPDLGCVLIKESPTLNCLGSPNGNIYLYDKNTNTQTNVIEAHSGTISDFDISDNMLVSCGFASRGNNDLSVKRSLLLYDLRMMRSLNAIHCSIDPLQLKFMPMYHSQVLIASQTGQFQQLEVTSTVPQNNNCFEVDLAGNTCYGLDLSSTSKALAIGDTAGILHLLAAQDGTQFNAYSRPTIFPSETVLNFPKPIHIDDVSFSFAHIPMPLTNERLMSDWPPEFNRPGDRRPRPIDPEAVRNMKMVKYIGYTPNPNNMYKNTVPYDLSLLQQQRIEAKSPLKRPDDAVHIPRVYQQMKLDHSSLSELDLHNLNRTKFSVVCTTKRYKFLCPIVQMLYYIEPIALAVKAHICHTFHCLACELGILFFNLDNTEDKVTNADAFFTAFEQAADPKVQGVYFPERQPEPRELQQIAQSVVETLLRILDKEIAIHSVTTAIYLAFGSKVKQRLVCLACKHVREKSTINLTYTLSYPPNNKTPISFLDLLKKVMQHEVGRNILCDNGMCRNYKHIDSSILESLPYILHLNCGVHSQDDYSFWQHQAMSHNAYEKGNMCPNGRNCTLVECNKVHEQTTWLPLFFHIKAGKEQGQLVFKTGRFEEKINSRDQAGVFEYELYAVIAHVDNKTPQDHNHGLILHSNVSRNYHQKKGTDDNGWYIFNGISATCTSDREAVTYGQPWKTPCVIIYRQIKLPKEISNTPVPNPLEVLTPFTYIPVQGFNILPLSAAELPCKGDLVGMGIKIVKECLVRVVIVRGQGVHEGVAFSHDICPSSLNPVSLEVVQTVQQSMLTPPKLLYYKLKCLVDRGVIIVGHNLAKYLRHINMQVPAQQYINTAELYRSNTTDAGFNPPMDFLCSRILKVDYVPSPENIAVYSLQLYERFLELKRAGQFEKTLKSLHEPA